MTHTAASDFNGTTPHSRGDDLTLVATLAKALAHPARLKVVEILMRRQVCIGSDIVEEIGLAASTTSEHLRILRSAGLVIGEIERPRVCYSLNPQAVEPLLALLKTIRAAADGPLADAADDAPAHRASG